MREKYKGIIIKESLEDERVLSIIDVKKEEIEKEDDPKAREGYRIWHLLQVEFFRTELEKVIEMLEKDLKPNYWYADFRGKKEHYIIYRGKSFRCERGNKDSYKEAVEYGLRMGIPKKQLDFVS